MSLTFFRKLWESGVNLLEILENKLGNEWLHIYCRLSEVKKKFESRRNVVDPLNIFSFTSINSLNGGRWYWFVANLKRNKGWEISFPRNDHFFITWTNPSFFGIGLLHSQSHGLSESASWPSGSTSQMLSTHTNTRSRLLPLVIPSLGDHCCLE